MLTFLCIFKNGCGDPNYYGMAFIFELQKVMGELNPWNISGAILKSVSRLSEIFMIKTALVTQIILEQPSFFNLIQPLVR